MIETNIVHREEPTRVPERFLELVRHANNILKQEVSWGKLPYQATWSIRGGNEPRADLSLSCSGGNETVEYVDSDLRTEDQLRWLLKKQIWNTLSSASATIRNDINRRLDALGQGDQ